MQASSEKKKERKKGEGRKRYHCTEGQEEAVGGGAEDRSKNHEENGIDLLLGGQKDVAGVSRVDMHLHLHLQQPHEGGQEVLLVVYIHVCYCLLTLTGGDSKVNQQLSSYKQK